MRNVVAVHSRQAARNGSCHESMELLEVAMPRDVLPTLAPQTNDFTGDMRNVVAVLNGEAGRGATVRSFQSARIDVSGGRAGFRLTTDWVRPRTLIQFII